MPNLGRGKGGLACPTVRDFSVVDQDQSDNIPAGYLLTTYVSQLVVLFNFVAAATDILTPFFLCVRLAVCSDGRVAQATSKNKQTLGRRAVLELNGSDNGLLNNAIMVRVRCTLTSYVWILLHSY